MRINLQYFWEVGLENSGEKIHRHLIVTGEQRIEISRLSCFGVEKILRRYINSQMSIPV